LSVEGIAGVLQEYLYSVPCTWASETCWHAQAIALLGELMEAHTEEVLRARVPS